MTVERLTVQAAKYTAGELGRAIALLIDAQTDMRWTTSPRLSLELALIRATIPETDATPETLVSRLERLERVAGISAGSRPAPGWRLRAPHRRRASRLGPLPSPQAAQVAFRRHPRAVEDWRGWRRRVPAARPTRRAPRRRR